MAENFRNKQWFKKLPQERKDEICTKFSIDEKTLRKAGRETEDGRIVIDLLRIGESAKIPESWYIKSNIIEDKVSYSFVESLKSVETSEEMIEIFKNLYSSFIKEKHKYLKYKNNIHNDVLVYNIKKYIINDIDSYLNPENTVDDKAYYANRMYERLTVLLDSDLKIFKYI